MRLGYDVIEGKHIVTVAKGIHGISVANIEPYRNLERKKKQLYLGYQIDSNSKTQEKPTSNSKWIISMPSNSIK
ncbi:12133_t:CDS:2 [Entrophospora sp. SA101]|nr:12133_t:CDS:2 [Entrophospora sp. SA101]